MKHFFGFILVAIWLTHLFYAITNDNFSTQALFRGSERKANTSQQNDSTHPNYDQLRADIDVGINKLHMKNYTIGKLIEIGLLFLFTFIPGILMLFVRGKPKISKVENQ